TPSQSQGSPRLTVRQAHILPAQKKNERTPLKVCFVVLYRNARGDERVKVVSIGKVLEAVGSAAELRRTMHRAGQPFPSFQTIRNWARRDSIPGPWVGAVLWSLACRRINPIDLLRETREPLQNKLAVD